MGTWNLGGVVMGVVEWWVGRVVVWVDSGESMLFVYIKMQVRYVGFCSDNNNSKH